MHFKSLKKNIFFNIQILIHNFHEYMKSFVKMLHV